ncbi:MAG: FG-GAP-like repeat-containing protein [Deltaproteobacteria bacterium]
MKNVLRFFIIFILLTFASGSLWAAKEKNMIAVLPFAVHSGENIDYVRQGIWDMLSSRISVADKIEVLSKDMTLNFLKETGGKDLTLADVYGLGKKMKVDYVIWGSITKIGNSLSIDGKLVDIAAYKSTVSIFAQSQGMDDVIPKINDFAQRIDQHILGIAPTSSAVSSPVSPQAPSPQEKSTMASRESDVISGMRKSKQGTLTSFINPDFINTTEPIIRKNFWMSQKTPTEFKGMDIGDVNGDGMNEVVIIDSRNVMIYQKKDKDLFLVQKIPGQSYDNYLSVDVADINQNGTKEIIVTNLTGTTLESFILEFRDGKFVPIASKLPWFLRVIETSSGQKLLGQLRGFDKPFDTPIFEIVWEDRKYTKGKRMKIPEGLSVYGLTLDTLGIGTSEKILAIDEDDYLFIYEQTDKPLAKLQTFGGNKERIWKSDDVFGGSNNVIDTAMQTGPDRPDKNTYINLRILTYDFKNDGKKEIIIVKNLSSVGRVFRNVKAFSSSEVYNLEWDGLGLLENWKTKKINGYVADYQFKDIDNDGQKEIVLALVLASGQFVTNSSVIVVYKMNPQ